MEFNQKDRALIENCSHCMDLVQNYLNLESQERGFVRKDLPLMANKPDRMVVQFRNLKSEDGVFALPFGKQDSYNDIVDRVATILGVDRHKIMLTTHICSVDKPAIEYIKFQFEGCLLDILNKKPYDKICNVLYYEVLDAPYPEWVRWRTIEVAYRFPYNKMSVALPEDSTIKDLLNGVKKKLEEYSTRRPELCLLGIRYCEICEVYNPDFKIQNIPEGVDLLAQDIPEGMYSPGYHQINVYHFIKTDEGKVTKFGTPFLLCIRELETLADVKARIQKQLLVENEEFSKWKFTSSLLEGSKYLSDAAVLIDRSEEVHSPQCLGLEHFPPDSDDDYSCLF